MACLAPLCPNDILFCPAILLILPHRRYGMDGSVVACALLGTACGVVTGLVPGIHVNTAAPLAVALASNRGIAPLPAASFICALSLTHTFIDFIPTTLLGIPSEDTAVAALPAHRMVLMGRGLEAIRLSGLASLFAVVSLVICVYPSLALIRGGYPLVKAAIPFVLVVVLARMIASHGTLRRMGMAALVVALSGVFGWAVLTGPVWGPDPLFPVFSGMFGISTLLISMRGTCSAPPQSLDAELQAGRNEMLCSMAQGTLAGSCVALIPGIGASQAALLVVRPRGHDPMRGYICSCCAINTANALFALMVLQVGGAARNGALVHVQRLLGTVTPPTFHALLAVMCLAAGLAYPLLMALARLLMPALSRVSYRRLSLVGIVFQGVLVCALSGILGALLCAVATAVGLLPALMGVHRSTVMSFLLIPVLSFYT